MCHLHPAGSLMLRHLNISDVSYWSHCLTVVKYEAVILALQVANLGCTVYDGVTVIYKANISTKLICLSSETWSCIDMCINTLYMQYKLVCTRSCRSFQLPLPSNPFSLIVVGFENSSLEILFLKCLTFPITILFLSFIPYHYFTLLKPI